MLEYEKNEGELMCAKENTAIKLDVIEILKQLGISLERLKETNLFPEEIARLEKKENDA